MEQASGLTTQVTRMQSKTMSALPGMASRPDAALPSPANSSISISLSLPLCARGDGAGRFLTCSHTGLPSSSAICVSDQPY